MLHAGAFGLPPTLIAQLVACSTPDCSAPYVPPQGPPQPPCAPPPAACRWSVMAIGGTTYYYYTSGWDRMGVSDVGDMRVALRSSTATAVSVLAVQQGAGAGAPTFAPYVARSGHSCFLLDVGTASAAQMTAEALARNAAATWALRLLGFVMMWVGLLLVLKPLSVAADLVPLVGPFIGDLVSIGAAAVTAPIAASLSLLTAAFAWVAVRPALGVPLLFLGLGAPRRVSPRCVAPRCQRGWLQAAHRMTRPTERARAARAQPSEAASCTCSARSVRSGAASPVAPSWASPPAAARTRHSNLARWRCRRHRRRRGRPHLKCATPRLGVLA